ncbi:Dimerisation domain-containing protein [Desulforhopalus singaporensis]|uniref:Dimerisation domain-containing protein n=2 Tax=Desulforhopalus singaporensis TaxID=91360 RepID=A0A1H0LZD8_9BACT|nr:Dimerisation domain-containing protein [Desulforhopalus singaporensis]
METGWSVGKLLDISSGYWKGCVVQAAVRLDLFSCLGDTDSTADEVACNAGTDPRATSLLLDALAALKLIDKVGGRYCNSEFSKTFLVRESPSYQGHIIKHHHHIMDGWVQLDKAVTTGKKVARRSYGEQAERESFLLGMFNLASNLAPKIAEKFPLKDRKHLLDLGGGPGTYAIQFCLKNPGLKAVIFDRPTTEPFARKTVDRYQLGERIRFVGGDFTVDPLGDDSYDAVWMSHILHSNTLEQCEKFIIKAAQLLDPGGLLMVHDFFLNAEKDGPEFPALFALNMLVGTDGGRSYSSAEVTSLLHRCGFSQVKQHRIDVPNESSVITAIKK